MRKDFGVKTWLYPQPVFVIATYDSNGVPDAMCAAWGGITYPTLGYLSAWTTSTRRQKTSCAPGPLPSACH